MTSAELLDGKNAAEVIEQVKSYLLGLQDTICQTLELADGKGQFVEDVGSVKKAAVRSRH